MKPNYNELDYFSRPIDPLHEFLGFYGVVYDTVTQDIFATAVSGNPASLRRLLVRKLRKIGFEKEDYSFLLMRRGRIIMPRVSRRRK